MLSAVRMKVCNACLKAGAYTVTVSHPELGPMNLSQLLRKGGSPRLHCRSLSARQASLMYPPISSLHHHITYICTCSLLCPSLIAAWQRCGILI